jgi:hypothetical protein
MTTRNHLTRIQFSSSHHTDGVSRAYPYEQMLSKTSSSHLNSVEIRNNRPISFVLLNEMVKAEKVRNTNRTISPKYQISAGN